MSSFLIGSKVTTLPTTIAAMGRAKPAPKTVPIAQTVKVSGPKENIKLDAVLTPLQKQYGKNQGGGGISVPPPEPVTTETPPEYSVEEAIKMATSAEISVDLTPVAETQEKLQSALTTAKADKKSLADKWNALSDTNKALIAVGGTAAIMGAVWYFSQKK